MTDVLDTARAWLAQDPDAETRAELEALIERRDLDELHDRFDRRLEFGTAGLRGRIEAGSNRMNRVLVSQAAAGLAAYLIASADGNAPSIVIGYDGRKNSRVFATDTAEIMAGAGIRTTLLPRMLPTPVLAFAVRHLDASAGVMVTASHNPGHDNGYKVYLGGDSHGSQIVAPADADIAAQIERVAAELDVLELERSTGYATAGEDLLDAYVAATVSIAAAPNAPVAFVYTAMHGVGWETAQRVFSAAGFGTPVVVAAQIDPDPDFPTVTFPNPEEPGALDLAIETAVASGSELAIANDPDADRFAVAVPDSDGEWHRLSGNEVGNLLGWRAADRLSGSGEEGTLAASVVSSPALAEIASQYGLEYVDTLTGFKWISRVPGLSFGFEEALGYLVDPAKIRDKDGISAALDFLGLVADLRAAGKTLDEHRRDFAERFGAFVSSQISIRVVDLARIGTVMTALRAHQPEMLGSRKVRRMDDFADGFGGLPPSDILRLWLDDGSRVIVRPSGTEPKLKVYIDASSTTGDASARQAAAQRAVDELDAAVRPLVSLT